MGCGCNHDAMGCGLPAHAACLCALILLVIAPGGVVSISGWTAAGPTTFMTRWPWPGWTVLDIPRLAVSWLHFY